MAGGHILQPEEKMKYGLCVYLSKTCPENQGAGEGPHSQHEQQRHPP